MRLVIRDDDLSFFTDPKLLEQLYGKIWSSAPITFAAIPFIAGSNKGKPNEQTDGRFPLGNNKPLVSMLKKLIHQGKVDIAIHGYSHRIYNGKFEYERTKKTLLLREIHEAKKYLEKLFETKIFSFVAPHDRFSREAIEVIEEMGLNICRGFAPLPREISLTSGKYLKNISHIALYALLYGTHRRYPHILDFGKHKELYSYRIEHLLEEDLSQVLALANTLCVTNHYWDMGVKKQVLLRKLIKMANADCIRLRDGW